MHLARTVTHATVRETKIRMSSREFEQWKAAYRIMPWGDDWQQAGTIAAASIAGWTKKRIKAEDFIPKAKVKKTPAQIEAMMNQWAMAHNRNYEKRNQVKQSQLSGKSTQLSQPRQDR